MLDVAAYPAAAGKKGIHPVIVEYLKTPPSKTPLKKILKSPAMEPRELMQKKEIEAMVAHPRLIERPIVVIGDRAAIGRPPENVLRILKA